VNPEITVLMPVRNGQAYVREALRSLWRQTFREFEVWVFNDGSTDATAELLEEEKVSVEAAGRLQVEHCDENRGISRTMNEGIRRARGTWIARMDADDVSRSLRFEHQRRYLLEHPEVSICGSWVQILKKNRMHRHTPPVDSATLRCMLGFQNPLVHSSVMWNREHLVKSGLFYDESLTAAQDMELWFRCSQELNLRNLDEILVEYRVHEDNITTTRSDESRGVRMSVMTQALASMGLDLDPDQMQHQVKIGEAGEFADPGELEKAGRHLLQLQDQCRAWEEEPREAFGRASAWCWNRACANSAFMGSRMLRIWHPVARALPTPPASPGGIQLSLSALKSICMGRVS